MSDTSPRTVIVVPCYNEEKRLDTAAFLAFVADRGPELRFLMVDDGSSDGTATVLQSLVDADDVHFERLVLPFNRGKAEAVRTGILHATPDADFVGFWDADLATPLRDIDPFVGLMRDRPAVDIVMGSRVALLGRDIRRDPRRHYFGRIAATAVSVMLGLRVYDTQCGAKLFRVGPLTEAAFGEPFLTRWMFDVEILARFILSDPHGEPDRRVVEVPLLEWTDVADSRLTPADFVRAPMDLLRIRNYYFGQ